MSFGKSDLADFRCIAPEVVEGKVLQLMEQLKSVVLAFVYELDGGFDLHVAEAETTVVHTAEDLTGSIKRKINYKVTVSVFIG